MWNSITKKYDYNFSEQELRDGFKRCLDNVRGLLASAKILNLCEVTQQYALGLYMYAVEEYGKAILLKNVITGNKGKYKIDGWILGDGYPKRGNAHDEKIKTGLNNLPED
jgi:AbiV family abortive infection protein